MNRRTKPHIPIEVHLPGIITGIKLPSPCGSVLRCHRPIFFYGQQRSTIQENLTYGRNCGMQIDTLYLNRFEKRRFLYGLPNSSTNVGKTTGEGSHSVIQLGKES
ncbi:hypothetical protein TNCV_2647371 [Trichonephila clavipes]|nr:hypothetical protein TNCV_2647371 [Trichonephila clavipes]